MAKMDSSVVVYKGKRYLKVKPVPSLMHSRLISDVIERGDLLVMEIETNILTVIPGGPEFSFFYMHDWHILSNKYKYAMEKLEEYKNVTHFTCSLDPNVQLVHPDWSMFKLQLMEYYQRWSIK